MVHQIRYYTILWTAGTGFHKGNHHKLEWFWSKDYNNEMEWESEKIRLKHKVVKLARSHLARCTSCTKFTIREKDSKLDETWREDEYEGWKDSED